MYLTTLKRFKKWMENVTSKELIKYFYKTEILTAAGIPVDDKYTINGGGRRFTVHL